MLDHLDRSATNRIAAALDPLRDDNGRHPTPATDTGADVTEHGARGSIATRLQIHRQTPTARILRIEELTGLSMSSPGDRPRLAGDSCVEEPGAP